MIYEAIDRQTGELVAAFEAPHDQRAGFRLRYECRKRKRPIDPASIRMRAADPAAYPHIRTAMFDWLKSDDEISPDFDVQEEQVWNVQKPQAA